MNDLIEFADSTFPTKAERSGRMIAGLSMGGYGAVKLALKYPEVFCSAVGFSGAFRTINDDDLSEDRVGEYKLIFGDDFTGSRDDIFSLVQKSDKATMPALRLDCGTEDFLIEHNRRLHQLLLSLDIEHDYVELPGEHNWVYWDRGIVDALPFIRRTLQIK